MGGFSWHRRGPGAGSRVACGGGDNQERGDDEGAGLQRTLGAPL